MATLRSDSRLQNSLADILRLLERHRVLDNLALQEGRRRDMLENLPFSIRTVRSVTT